MWTDRQTSGESKADKYIGHILHCHYVALDRNCEVTSHRTKDVSHSGKELPVSEADITDSTSMQPNDIGHEYIYMDTNTAEEKAALEKNAYYVVFHMKVNF